VLLDALPPVLVLHLERFLDDATAGGMVKFNKPIEFTPELEIPPGKTFSFLSFVLAKAKDPSWLSRLEIMAPIPGKSVEPAHYKLHGVLYHHGGSGRGHHTVDVLHPNGDSGSGEGWLHIDDEAVSAALHENVFRGHGDQAVDDRCAYLLFYCRAAPTRT
jgi:ubiquitin carboxyl-terminal hydrolase 10